MALTHWPKLALILRGEIQRIREADRLLPSPLLPTNANIFPGLISNEIDFSNGCQFRFPNHFLGFGQAAHEPSLGLLLADALRYLSTGSWWMVVFPGLMRKYRQKLKR